MNAIAVGIAHGFVGWTLMSVSRVMPWPIDRFLERQAVLAACRMREISGGVDDGADALVEGWGAHGQQVIQRLLDRNRIPPKHLRVARLFVGIF